MKESADTKPETIPLMFDCTNLDDDISNPESEKTALKLGMLDVPIYPDLTLIPTPYQYKYYAIGTVLKYSLYGVLPKGGLKEIWKDRENL